MSGFIAMRRDARDHPLFRKHPERFFAWFWMLAEACWRPAEFDIKGKVVPLQRGQFCTSRNRLAEVWGWSPSAVERFLTRLETEQMIGRETGQGRSIITIRNYDKYQRTEKQTGQATGQATGHKSDSHRTAKEEGNQLPLPNGNGAGDFWTFAVSYLGEPKRSLIGRWCRDHGGQGPVAQAITAAQLERAVDPISYIEKTLRRQKSHAEEMPIV